MTEKRRSERESTLLELGFDLASPTVSSVPTLDVANSDTSLAFSGYGEFTPITVRSETVLEDANLERNQH